MSSIQERLQLKRVPLDTWNIREQLCLASAVVRSGDQNWMSVSRALKTIGESNRPSDWYSQKSCAAQYGALLEHVETPKRKKRNSEGAIETPQESILKKLTQERIVEIQKNVTEMNQIYEQLKSEIAEVRNPQTSDERLRELWTNIETAKRAKEREVARRAAWLKEREERRSRAERPWRPSQPTTPTSPASSPQQAGPPASPLLTSLLKSSPVVTTPQHITHPANVVDVVSPSVTAPTLSMLLEKSAVTNCSQHESRHAAIEHIKNQLQEIEHQFNVATTSGVQLPVPVATVVPPIPAVDIDDIEIKAEDVYAFRDVDIHIPPVGHIHKVRTPEKPVLKKEDMEIETDTAMPTASEAVQEEFIAKDEPTKVSAVEENILLIEEPDKVEEIPPATPTPADEHPASTPAKELNIDDDLKINFPEVKFPTTEIKVIQPEEQKIKEEIKEPPESDVPKPEPELKEEEVKVVEEAVVEAAAEPIVKEEQVEEKDEQVIPEPAEPDREAPGPAADDKPILEEVPMKLPLLQDIPLPPGEPLDVKVIDETPLEPPLPPDETVKTSQEEEEKPKIKEEIIETEVPEHSYIEENTEDKSLSEIKREEEAEDSMPLKAMLKLSERQTEDVHTETDDDTPMELSREEEKDGKKKRDYSRKKKSESRTWSGSESAAEASAPESPGGGGLGAVSASAVSSGGAGVAVNDAERHHRLWKKSIMPLYNRLCAHKYASLFVRPISDEEAPDYSVVVKRPMDLLTIRRNIDNGTIRTTAEFQRDVLLMLSNALMYNSSEHSVYRMTKEMHEETQCQLGMFLAAQAHATLCAEPTSSRRKRRRNDDNEQHQRKRTH